MKAKTRQDGNASFAGHVREVLDTKVRPYLDGHGGGLKIKEIKGNDVGIVLTGACMGCPAAQITLEETIDRLLREEIGEELGRVYLVNEVSDELLGFAKQLLSKE